MKEAEDNLQTIARFNGVNPRDNYLKENLKLLEIHRTQREPQQAETNTKYTPLNQTRPTETCNGDNADDDNENGTVATQRYSAIDVIKSAILLRSFLILALCW